MAEQGLGVPTVNASLGVTRTYENQPADATATKGAQKAADVSDAKALPKLPEGSFIGKSPDLEGRDRMSLMLRKDPKNPNGYYAVLSEYERVGVPWSAEKTQITRWVPRMHHYYVEPKGPDTFSMWPTYVTKDGGILMDPKAISAELKTKGGNMAGAVITRRDSPSARAERISFDGSPSVSTWEPYIPGNYFRSKDPSGDDYTKKTVNTFLSKDMVATFNSDELQGSYRVTEKAPGMFTLKAVDPKQPGKEQVESKILVFIDIVNWKSEGFTTNEAMLIDPANPKNVGFFYERHDRDHTSNIDKHLKTAKTILKYLF